MSIYDEIYETAFEDELQKVAAEKKQYDITTGDALKAGLIPYVGLESARKKHLGKEYGAKNFGEAYGHSLRYMLDSAPSVLGRGVAGAGAGAGAGMGVGALAAKALKKNKPLAAAAGAGLGATAGWYGGAISGLKPGLNRHLNKTVKRREKKG